MSSTIAERVRTLESQRTPFVHATVVRAQEPTSARPGDAAVILGDGTIEGFVGGVCAESSVRAAALDTLRDGRTLLLRVLPDSSADFPETPGALVVVNPCLSGGAVEIFLRPVLPAPVIRVVGSTPISEAVARLAEFLDYEVDRSSGGSADSGAGSSGRRGEPGDWAGATAVVVAGLGKGEEGAIRAALDAGVGFVALVASRKRGAGVLDEMALSATERARVHTPAGMDIGARTPQEIALSIMGEVVQAIRVDGLTAPSAPAREAPREAIDPVCGMTVFIGPDTPHAVVAGQDYWFCRPGCLDAFTERVA
jgi:xanthine dehydrogenase accessory factor